MKPIIMSAESVRAILDGRKTQTRRVIKPQPWWIEPPTLDGDQWIGPYTNDGNVSNGTYAARCPYPVGSRWWVREKWRPVWLTPRPRTETLSVVQYAADSQFNRDDWGGVVLGEKWESPILLSRNFSRLTVEVTENGAGRVQELTYEDMEILSKAMRVQPVMRDTGASNPDDSWINTPDYAETYALEWNKHNPQCPYDSNPWVWSTRVRRIQ